MPCWGCIQGLGRAPKHTGLGGWGVGQPAGQGRMTLSLQLPQLFQWFGLFLIFNFRYLFLKTPRQESEKAVTSLSSVMGEQSR